MTATTEKLGQVAQKTEPLGTNWALTSSGDASVSSTTNYENWALVLGGESGEEKTPGELASEFVAWAKSQGSRGQGPRGLRSPAMRFLKWLESSGLSVSDLDRRAAKAYRSALLDEGLAPRTVKTYLETARKIAQWLMESGLATSNPFVRLRGPRVPQTVLKDVPKEAQMGRLLAALADWESAGPDPRRQGRRYIAHVMAELQYATGLRVSEVAALELEDIDFQRNLVHVRDGKKGRTRWAYLNEYAAEVLRVYIDEMRPVVLTAKQSANRHLVFGAGLDSLGHAQNEHLRKASQEVGVRITSHGLRHALGYHLLRSGCPLRHIQEILGHVSIKDTEVYTKVDVSGVQEVVDACHPRGIVSLGHAP